MATFVSVVGRYRQTGDQMFAILDLKTGQKHTVPFKLSSPNESWVNPYSSLERISRKAGISKHDLKIYTYCYSTKTMKLCKGPVELRETADEYTWPEFPSTFNQGIKMKHYTTNAQKAELPVGFGIVYEGRVIKRCTMPMKDSTTFGEAGNWLAANINAVEWDLFSLSLDKLGVTPEFVRDPAIIDNQITAKNLLDEPLAQYISTQSSIPVYLEQFEWRTENKHGIYLKAVRKRRRHMIKLFVNYKSTFFLEVPSDLRVEELRKVIQQKLRIEAKPHEIGLRRGVHVLRDPFTLGDYGITEDDTVYCHMKLRTMKSEDVD